MRAYLTTLPQVKPTRRTVRKAAPFGQGILPSRPLFTRTWTSQDEQWAAEVFNATPTALDRHFDELAAESAMLDRYTRGTLPL